MRVACWNSNGHLAAEDASVIVELVQQLRLDVLMISDSRLTQRAANYHFKTIKRALKGYSTVGMHTTRSSYTQGGGARMNTMGGTFFIVSPRCAQKIINTGHDGSGLGVAGYVLVEIAGVKYSFISVYQPIGGDAAGPSTVLARLQAYLHKRRISENPRTYVLNVVARWVTSFTQKGYQVLVGGDFNSDPRTSAGNRLRIWAEELCLDNLLQRAIPNSYYTHLKKGEGVSCIDHIYASQTIWGRVLRARVIQRPQLTALSDHCVIYVALEWRNGLPHAQMASQQLQPRRIELRAYDADMMSEYQHEMEQWAATVNLQDHDASSGLRAIMQQSVKVTQELGHHSQTLAQRVGFRSSFKDGYSPFFLL